MVTIRDIVQFVLSSNLNRRHLMPGQMAVIVAQAQDWGKAQTVASCPKKVADADHFSDRAKPPQTGWRFQVQAEQHRRTLTNSHARTQNLPRRSCMAKSVCQKP